MKTKTNEMAAVDGRWRKTLQMRLLGNRALLAFGLSFCCVLSGCAQTGAVSSSRSATAEAMFKERCNKAGEFIHRTVENVEGIYLLKIRASNTNYGESIQQQYALDDPYGHDFGGPRYIESFLRGSYQANHGGASPPEVTPRLGYGFVEAINSSDGLRYRYTASMQKVKVISSRLTGGSGNSYETESFVLSHMTSPGPAPRYGVTFDDISIKEERDHWIAGSSLKVIDLSNNEVIAERIGYMFDRGQGNRSGGRSPWLSAASDACPSFSRIPGAAYSTRAFLHQVYQTLDFVEKVLKPVEKTP